MANIPDTTTFTLQNVVDIITPTTNDLVDCFSDATDAFFDYNYKGDKDNLLNFRNYGDKAWFGYMNYRTFTLLETPVKLWHTYSSVFGSLPDSITSYDPLRLVETSEGVSVFSLGYLPVINLDNSIAEVTQSYEPGINTLGDLFDNVSGTYSGRRIGDFHYLIQT